MATQQEDIFLKCFNVRSLQDGVKLPLSCVNVLTFFYFFWLVVEWRWLPLVVVCSTSMASYRMPRVWGAVMGLLFEKGQIYFAYKQAWMSFKGKNE